MPQDSVRSFVYRSFLTCDDPKGVVECGMIRRSKSGSERMEHIKEGRKVQNGSNAYMSPKTERDETVSKGATEELHSSPSGQLLEVSRGAHKLNQVIDSWSRGIRYDGHSKDLAKDLLKGALDLQNSLHVLGKLQEASHYMAKLKKKEKERVRNDQLIQRTNYGSSNDCIEELRKVVRDSLARQNLLPNKNAEDKKFSSKRYSDSASDIPSTSSSQSSAVQMDNFASIDSSILSAAPEKKARGPSLIAKLMGLEEMPSKSLQTDSQKDLESKKVFGQQRPVYEIDTPKVRKSQFESQKEDAERRTLKDILETMHYKGLLKRNSIKDMEPEFFQSSDLFCKQRLVDDSRPIVLIKPRYDPYFQQQEKFAPVFQEEGSLNTEIMLKNFEVKETPSKLTDSNSRGLKFNEVRRRGEVEKIPVKRHSLQEAFKDSREKEASSVKKEVLMKERLPTKMKSLPSLKKEANGKNFEKIPKVMSSRKLVEKEVSKPKNISKSKDQAMDSHPKPNKPEHGSNVTKNRMSRMGSTTANSSSNGTPKASVCSPNEWKKSPRKKEKAVNKSAAAKVITEKLECKGDDAILEEKGSDLTYEDNTVLEGKRIDSASERSSVPEGKSICPIMSEYDAVLEGYSPETADQLPTEGGTGHTDNQIGEYGRCSESCTCDDEKSRKSVEVDDDPTVPMEADSISFLRGNDLIALLLSSPDFLNQAEELFHLHVNVAATSSNYGISNFSDANKQLTLDCANEIVRRKSFPDSQMVQPPLLDLVGDAKSHISLYHLLKGICDSVEDLKSYSKLASENYPIDSLYAMLESDIKCSEVLSGIWDLGWKKYFSVDDTIQVVDDIEKQLLSGLIEEICA